MKLTQEQKQRINDYFESKSEEEVMEILKGYGLKETKYTLDELKKRVNDLKDYATKLSSELNVGLSIEVETDIDDYIIRGVKGSSRINIMD